MRSLAIYLLYAATALRGALLIAARRDPTLTIVLLAAYGLLLSTEPWVSRRLRTGFARTRDLYRAVYLLAQVGLILGMLLPGPTPDAFLALFFPLAFQAVQFFGWRAGRWWIASFLAPMLAYVIRHPDPNNLIMAPIFEGACFLLGALAYLADRAEQARAKNMRMAQELQAAQKELEQYASQVEELARERARTELSRELHDSVTQTVFSMNLAVQAARLTLHREPARAQAQLGRVVELANGALGEIQKLVGPLEPRPQEGQSLENGLRQLAERFRHRDGLEVCLELRAGRELSPAASAGLCHIVQETLTNVSKHAGTNQARLTLDLSERPSWLEVEDAGRGFDPALRPAGSGHVGLAEMAERAREIGWRFSLDSQPGRGTRVRVEENPEGAE